MREPSGEAKGGRGNNEKERDGAMDGKKNLIFAVVPARICLPLSPSLPSPRHPLPSAFTSTVSSSSTKVRRDIGYVQSANTLTSVTGANRCRSRTHRRRHEKIRFVSVIRTAGLVDTLWN